jgi:hypothetical protein
MRYVLVSLVGDEATQQNDEFARWFASEHVPVRAFHEEQPDHRCVKAAVQEAKTAIVMGHDGGGSLRARSAGPPWATAAEFAAMFRNHALRDRGRATALVARSIEDAFETLRILA